MYEGPSQTDFPRPYYVDDYKVGVIDAKVDWTLNTGTWGFMSM